MMTVENVEVEIMFNKTGVSIKMPVRTPLGTEIIEKTFSYDEISKRRWNIEIQEIIPIMDNNVLKAIRLKGILKKVSQEVDADKDTKYADSIEDCIRTFFPNIKGERLEDLKAVIKYMTKGYSRIEAIKMRAKDKDVYPQTVHSNLTRGIGITTDELDKRLNNVLKCLKGRALS